MALSKERRCLESFVSAAVIEVLRVRFAANPDLTVREVSDAEWKAAQVVDPFPPRVRE
jgi:hypothetical protein